MNSQPKISVIVPVYKVENFLDRCVESIVGQTYENLEIILVDDGSPDNFRQCAINGLKRTAVLKLSIKKTAVFHRQEMRRLILFRAIIYALLIRMTG